MNELYEIYDLIFQKGCRDSALLAQKMTADMRMVSYRRGEEIVTIFDDATKSYLVYEGEYSELNYSASGEKTLLAVRNAPQLIGIVAILAKDKTYQTDMIATRDVKAIEVDNAYFLHELENNGKLGILIIRNLTDKIIVASNRVRRKRFFDSRDNLIIYLYEQWKKNGAVQDSFWLTRSNRLIAEELDITERTLYRALHDLKEEKYVTVVDGNIYLNKEQIQAIVDFCDNAFGEDHELGKV